MSILAAVKGFLGDGFAGKAMDFIQKRWPPDMSESDRAQMELIISDALHGQEMELMAVANEQQHAFDNRIKDLEGTASDLKGIPFLGPIVIFLRGTQRPIWGFFVLYIDGVWFTTSPTYTEQQQTALIVINVLVLSFLFGERALKNLEPLIMRVFGGKQDG